MPRIISELDKKIVMPQWAVLVLPSLLVLLPCLGLRLEEGAACSQPLGLEDGRIRSLSSYNARQTSHLDMFKSLVIKQLRKTLQIKHLVFMKFLIFLLWS